MATLPVASVPGSRRETLLPKPIQLYAGQRYRIGAYTAGVGTNFARFDLPATFAHGSIHQSYEAFGDSFPITPHPARWWFVDLVYSMGSFDSLILAPDAATFVNGAWTGNITISTAATSVLLRAEDGAGHVGLADRFSVLSADIVRFTAVQLAAPNLLLTFTTVPGKSYQLHRTDNLLADNWTVLTNVLANANTMQISDSTGGGRQFYRICVLP
jgi:hypothetical protein